MENNINRGLFIRAHNDITKREIDKFSEKYFYRLESV